jgi:hypothetical protein
MHKPVTGSDIAAYRLFALLCPFMLMLGPVMSYRNQRGVSMERAVYGRLLNLFGTFMPMSGGGIAAADIRRTKLFAASFLFQPEEGAAGEMNEVRIRLCNTAFYTRDSGQDTLVFRGLLILCEPRLRTESIIDVALADRLRPALRARLEELALAINALPEQKTRWDETITYGLAALAVRLKDRALARMGKNELPSEKTYRQKYAVTRRLTRATRPEAPHALCTPYAFEYSYEASLTAIADHGTAFTLGSLFWPALDNARADHFYTLMQAADAITRHVHESTLRA